MDVASKLFNMGQKMAGRLGALVIAAAFPALQYRSKNGGGSNYCHLMGDHRYDFTKDMNMKADLCGMTAGA